MLPDSPEMFFLALGLGLIGFGVVLVVLATTWRNHYERPGDHARPREVQPWHREPTGERHHHRYRGTRNEETRHLAPVTNKARTRVVPEPSRLRLTPSWREEMAWELDENGEYVFRGRGE